MKMHRYVTIMLGSLFVLILVVLSPVSNEGTAVSAAMHGTDLSDHIAKVGNRDLKEFDRGIDGFRFKNYGSGLLQAPYDFRLVDMRELFGDDAVCYTIKDMCFWKVRAHLWRLSKLPSLKSGYCYGFAATSLLLNGYLGAENRNQPWDFMPGAIHTYDILNKSYVNHYIALNHMKQFTPPVGDSWIRGTPNHVLTELVVLLEDYQDRPLIMIRNRHATQGHLLVPISFEGTEPPKVWLHVYDSNNPVNSENNETYIEFDLDKNTWKYDHQNGLGVWDGDARSSTIRILPISKHNMRAEAPWQLWDSPSSANIVNQVELSLLGAGRLLIVDDNGARLGFDGDSFINEIPDANTVWTAGGLGIGAEPLYWLPSTQTYTLVIDGKTTNDPGLTGIAKFDESSAIMVDNIEIDADTHDLVTVSPDKGITYSAKQTQEVNMRIATDAGQDEYLVEMLGIDLLDDDVMSLELNDSRRRVLINLANASTSEYSLNLTKLSPSGESHFAHETVAIGAGDSQIIELDSLTEYEITVCVDIGSNGVVDSCNQLPNEAVPQDGTQFLPFISR